MYLPLAQRFVSRLGLITLSLNISIKICIFQDFVMLPAQVTNVFDRYSSNQVSWDLNLKVMFLPGSATTTCDTDKV